MYIHIFYLHFVSVLDIEMVKFDDSHRTDGQEQMLMQSPFDS